MDGVRLPCLQNDRTGNRNARRHCNPMHIPIPAIMSHSPKKLGWPTSLIDHTDTVWFMPALSFCASADWGVARPHSGEVGEAPKSDEHIEDYGTACRAGLGRNLADTKWQWSGSCNVQISAVAVKAHRDNIISSSNTSELYGHSPADHIERRSKGR